MLPSVPIWLLPCRIHLSCRAPTLSLEGTDQTSATVVVKHPATTPFGGWVAMRLKVCLQDEPTNCPIAKLDCTNDFSTWDCAACSYCPLGGLLPAKQYLVEVRGAGLEISSGGNQHKPVLQCCVAYCSHCCCRCGCFDSLACRPQQ